MNTSASPVLVAGGLRFAEGINFDQQGTLYCVDVHGGRCHVKGDVRGVPQEGWK